MTHRFPSAAHATVGLLRSPALHLQGPDAIPLNRKDAALLAVLALDGGCPRDLLAQRLWPLGDMSKSRASLRQRLHRLARSAGMPLVSGDDTAHLAAGVQHELGDPDARLREDPAALQGELLEGLSFDDCPEFAGWLEGARARWRVTRAGALGRLAARLQEQGDTDRALEAAQRLCAEEPLSEHAHRQLMQLHHANGDLGAALRAYQRLAERLEAELGELPNEETAALAARLRLGQAPVRAAPLTADPVPATLRRPPRLIGREAAWAALQQGHEARVAVVVEGAPGVGKTRLLTDFAANWAPGSTLLVPCRAYDAQRPYALLVRLLSRLWLGPAALRPVGRRALPEWARHELAALLPELGSATPRTDAARLQRAVEVALQQARLEWVALDDVQNADVATLELLPSWVGEGLPAWVVAARAGELPAPVRQWLQASDAPQAVALAPLAAPEIAALLQDLALPGFEGAQWAEALAQYTGGLPLFVLETLRGMMEQPPEARRSLPVPRAVVQAIRARATHLPEAARQLAHAAAVLRAPLPPEAGAALLGGQPGQWLAPHALLEAAQWVDGRGVMHDLVSAALREAMPAAERRWLHGNVARWLVQAGDSGPAVAGHFEEAGLPQDAAEQLETAALRARRASRPAEEATLWERAAALWERLGRREREFEALRESVRPRWLASGDIEAAATAEKLLSKALSPLEQCAAKFEQVCVNVFMERPAEALAMLKQVREMAMAANAGAIVVEATIRVGVALNRLDRFAETLTLLEEVRPQLDLCGLGVRGLYLNTLMLSLLASHQLEQAVTTSRECLALMEQGEEWRNVALAATNLGFVLAECGRLKAARAVSERALHHLRRLGPVQGDFADIEFNCSAVLASMGELGSALKALQRSEAYLKAAHGARLQSLLNQLMDHLAVCHLLRNDAESAQGYLLQVVEDGSERVVEHARRRMIQAVVAAVQTRDPSNCLQQARDIAVGSSQEVLLDIEIDACAAWCGIGASDPQALLALEQRAWAIERGGLATRLAWYRVDALRRSGNAAAAALRARELLDQPLWPTMLLPCHWLWIAHAALAAAGDPQAPAVAARASEAHAMTLKDLGSLPGPPRDWQLAAAGSAVLA